MGMARARTLLGENYDVIAVIGDGALTGGNAVGDCLFYGAGAGKMPTASAVVADLLDAVSGRAKSPEWGEGSEDFLVPSAQLQSRWYVRAERSSGLADKFDCVCSDTECAAIIPECDEEGLAALLGSVEAKSVFRIIE